MAPIADLFQNSDFSSLCGEAEIMEAQKDFFIALMLYNRALAFTMFCPEKLAICYVEKARIFLDLGLIEHCLDSINYARKCRARGINERQLVTMKRKCNLIKETRRGHRLYTKPFTAFLKMNLEPNPRVPFLAKCLEMQESTSGSRRLITTRDLKAGDIIGVLTGSLPFIKFGFKFNYCFNCLKCNYFNVFASTKHMHGEIP